MISPWAKDFSRIRVSSLNWAAEGVKRDAIGERIDWSWPIFLFEEREGGWQDGGMDEGGDRGFLFRTTGLALLALAGWRLGEVGGLLAAKDQLLANREGMTQLAPLVLLGLFSYAVRCLHGKVSYGWRVFSF